MQLIMYTPFNVFTSFLAGKRGERPRISLLSLLVDLLKIVVRRR